MPGLLRSIVPTTGRLFAIGDIHGCCEELCALLKHLETVENLNAGDRVVFIGDYVDRGPDSRGVIEALLAFKNKFANTVFLRGNHEAMLLNFLGFEGEHGDFYLRNGGSDTLLSYGLLADQDSVTVRKQMPVAHLDFIRSTEFGVIIGPGIFVHAGLHPLKTLEEQTPEDMLWIREEFAQNIHKFEKTIVFGHTPYWQVFLNLPYKIGIDTGCVYDNVLSALDITGQRVLQVKRNGVEVKITSLEAIAAEG